MENLTLALYIEATWLMRMGLAHSPRAPLPNFEHARARFLKRFTVERACVENGLPYRRHIALTRAANKESRQRRYGSR